MQDDLYHATDQHYTVGEILPAIVRDTYFHLRQAAAGNGWIEDALEAARPASSVSRRGSRYACSYDLLCVAHCENERQRRITLGEAPSATKLYRIAFPDAVTYAPVCLVNLIQQSQGDQERVARLAIDYWAPTLSYKVFEALGGRMRILDCIEPVPPANSTPIALGADILMARLHFGVPRK